MATTRQITATWRQLIGVWALVEIVYQTVASMGDRGAPAGAIYAVLMTKGCSLKQCERLEQLLVRAGLVTKLGDVLYASKPWRRRWKATAKGGL
jgi:hypothetical protein